jgi:ATP-dependent Lhr-like helicase
MGAIDLVVQIEAPASIASGMQRIGRACHDVGGVPRGIVIAKHRADLLSCGAAAAAMRASAIEPIAYPRNPLDVLAQQIVAMAVEEPLGVDALYDRVRQAAPFAELPRSAFEGVLDMLAGRYPSDEFAGLRPRITWDRRKDTVVARTGARSLAVSSGGTIPDRGLYGVYLGGEAGTGRGGLRVGELDEEMVFELRVGQVFLLGASSWRADNITHDRVVVSPAPGEPGKLPFWHGDRPGRTLPFGLRVGELARKLAEQDDQAARAQLIEQEGLDANAAAHMLDFLRKQAETTGAVPSDRTIVVERTLDDLGDWRVCVLGPFGLRVFAPWALAVRARLARLHAGEIDLHYTDDGMVFRIPACDEPPASEIFFPSSTEIQDMVRAALDGSALFAARFRESAARALLLPRRFPGRRTPLWAQRRRAGDLLSAVSRFPSFPIVLEAYRECLADAFDMAGLTDVLHRVETRRIRLNTVTTRAPSPFAAAVLFSYVANFMYLGDAPPAERRAQALSIDVNQLREILGEASLRDLLSPEVLAEQERLLQKLEYPAKHADGVHDLLLSLGDLRDDEVAARTTPPDAAAAWLRDLESAGRIVRVQVAGEARVTAVEDAARLRDGLGAHMPEGIAPAFLEPVPTPLRDLLARYARTHGPFTSAQAARRLGMPEEAVHVLLRDLVNEGRLIEGEFLPQGTGTEFCDTEVLRVLRARSLARLRKQIEPVDDAAFTRFLLDWQGITTRRRGREGLLEVVTQLRGLALPATVLESEILPARVAGYQPWELDALCASGQVLWLGADEGRVLLIRRDDESLLARPVSPVAGELAARLREGLSRRGALFFADLVRELRQFPHQIEETLWAMVWAGEITNDTLDPLRRRLASPSGRDVPVGRWSLRPAARAFSETELRTDMALALLDRYGVVMREAAHAESLPGGFSAIYDVLGALEERGRVRRGYFVAGRGGLQFAQPGADERLRLPEPDAPGVVLSAVDPANPYGALIDWPATASGEGRPGRVAGAQVVIHRGALVGYLRGDTLLTFARDDSSARALAATLAHWIDRRGRQLFITNVNGQPAAHAPEMRFFVEADFHPDARGLRRRPQGTAFLDD